MPLVVCVGLQAQGRSQRGMNQEGPAPPQHRSPTLVQAPRRSYHLLWRRQVVGFPACLAALLRGYLIQEPSKHGMMAILRECGECSFGRRERGAPGLLHSAVMGRGCFIRLSLGARPSGMTRASAVRVSIRSVQKVSVVAAGRGSASRSCCCHSSDDVAWLVADGGYLTRTSTSN